MPENHEAPLAPDFEIDHPDTFGPYLLKAPEEISYYLNLLAKHSSLVTAYLDDGKHFFLTALAGLDIPSGRIYLDPPKDPTLHLAALKAGQSTLNANLDRVKMQMRLGTLQESQLEGRKMLTVGIPKVLLRLQRREFFRLEPPLTKPIECRIALEANGQSITIDMKVADISAGGISLNAPITLAENIQLDMLFRDCRLDIPDEGVLLVNLRVRKRVEFSANTGTHTLRIGCEFIGLPGSRLAMIERYITRIERERKARESGLVD